MLSPIGVLGSRLAYGSWKMICIRRRYAFRSAPFIVVMSRPSKRIEPDVGSIRRSRSRPTVVLPQPDSPTRPSVSPRWMSKLTPSTAWTTATVRWRTPPRTGKCLTRSRTSTSGAEPSLPALRGVAGRRRGRGRHARVPTPGSSRGMRLPAASWYTQHRTSWPVATGSSSGWTSVASVTSSSMRVRQRGANRQPFGRSMRFGTLPGMTDRLVLHLADHRDRADQATGVGVERPPEQGRHVRLLDDLAGIHDRHAVAHLGDDAQVVGDEDDRGPGLVAQVPHQVEDLGLDRDVQRGRGLVRDEQLGLARQRHRDHHALGHATRHLVRIGIEAASRIRDADHPQELQRPLPRGALLHTAVDLEHLGDLLADVPDRVQRGLRLLEDHADPVAADPLHVLVGQLEQIQIVEHHLARLDAARIGHEPHDRQAGHALAAAGLADEAHDLAAVDVEVDAVHGPDDAVARVEGRSQALHLEERSLATLVPGPPARRRDELLDDVPLDRRIEQRVAGELAVSLASVGGSTVVSSSVTG